MSSGLNATELLVCYVHTRNVLSAVTDVVRSFDVKNSTLLDFCVDIKPHTSQSLHPAQRDCEVTACG